MCTEDIRMFIRINLYRKKKYPIHQEKATNAHFVFT